MKAAAASAAESRSLADWLSWQEKLHPRDIALGLGRVGEVARRLGLTEQAPPTLTVGGTNGKGSSAHLAALIYQQAGYHVGLYTSPHLLHYNERVRINGQLASDADLCRAFTAIDKARGDVSLTYFEFGTLAALWLFREAQVQVQVLEVGLGGRLDAVNILDADVALITSIGIDHQDWLGDSRESIAREKAGIFRHGRAAVVAEPDPPSSLIEVAQACGARLLRRGPDFQAQPSATGWRWRGPAGTLDELPLPGLSGAAQLSNAAGVLAAVDALQPRCPVPASAIRSALPQLRVPGRCEQRGA
ncbi:MAG TPA: Mur ligase family protein, partial [Fontimonas sp.]